MWVSAALERGPEDKKKKKYARLLVRAMFPDPKWLLTLGFLCILEEIRQS